jgi:hypothetical protein
MPLAVVVALVFGLALGLPPPEPGSAADSVGFTPLMDMGTSTYLGFQGGLYEGGSNAVPADHEAVGMARAASVAPLDAAGNPSGSGKIVLLSVGMSNTTQEFCSASSALPCDSFTFMGQAAADSGVNHASLAIVNGAAGGQSASTWDSPADANYDRVRDTRLVPVGLTENQVQAVWVKVANPGPTVSLPSAAADAYTLETQTGNIVRALKVRYPNVRLVFLSSRVYAGYATTTLNPEPYAYESGFGAKWLIQAQIDQMRNGGIPVDMRGGDLNYDTVAPWIGWGPYLWADGLTPRSDGLIWQVGDFSADGTHPATSGRQKVGTMLHDFFYASPYTLCWFRTDTDGDGVSDACEGIDGDNDGFSDNAETGIGTDPQDACGVNAWPPDFDDSQEVDISDVLALKMDFGGTVPPAAARLDITPDGMIDVSDALAVKPFFGAACI